MTDPKKMTAAGLALAGPVAKNLRELSEPYQCNYLPEAAEYVEQQADHIIALIAEIKTLREHNDNLIAEAKEAARMFNAEERRANEAEAKLAALTRPPSDEEAEKHARALLMATNLEPNEPAAQFIRRLAQANKTAREEGFADGAREGWMRALVAYVDLDAEGDPDFIAAMDRRWPRALKPSGETKT